MIKRNVEVEVVLTAKELAKIFADANGDFQAEFFNELANEVKTWRMPFCFQLQAITDQDNLTSDGRWVMEQIGEYAYPYKAGTQ